MGGMSKVIVNPLIEKVESRKENNRSESFRDGAITFEFDVVDLKEFFRWYNQCKKAKPNKATAELARKSLQELFKNYVYIEGQNYLNEAHMIVMAIEMAKKILGKTQDPAFDENAHLDKYPTDFVKLIGAPEIPIAHIQSKGGVIEMRPPSPYSITR